MKEITFGLPEGVSIGDTLTLNPLMRINKNSTIQFSPCKRNIEIAELFLGICKIQFVDKNELLYDIQAIEKYGHKERKNPFEHATVNFLNIFDVKTNDLLPKIYFYDFDKDFALKTIGKYKKPICINMICGNYKDKNDFYVQHRMMPFDKWQKIINSLLNQGYDILHFGLREKLTEEIKGVNIINNLTLRQMAACFNQIKTMITVDSGGGHQLAVASGCNVYCLHPTDGNGYLANNYHYDDNKFWQLEKRRVFYDNFNEDFSNLKKLIKF